MHGQDTGFMAFWTHVPLHVEDEYVRFLGGEHMPERLAVDGFVGARLFVSHEPPTAERRHYMALYATRSLAALTSPAYLERLANPTGWTRRFMPNLWGSTRGAGACIISRGHAVGGWIAIVRTPETSRSDCVDFLDETLRMPGIVAAHVMRADEDASSVRTPGTAKHGPKLNFESLAVVEATGRESAEAGLASLARIFPHEVAGGDRAFWHTY